MKKIYFKSLIAAFCLLIGNAAIAQDTITVAQGLGTLEAAISENGGDVVYKLSAGSWYGLTSIVEVSDSTMGNGKGLVIIGEETDGMPAIIQVGVDGAGSVFPQLFKIFNDLTIKNVFLSAQDFSGIAGAGVIALENSVRLEIDNVTIDPAGTNYTFAGQAPSHGSKVFITNSLILRNGHMGGPNDGGIFANVIMDTLYFENNTVASSGQDFINGGQHSNPNHKFLWVNHNSFFWHDVWLKKTYNDQEIYMTNNLFHDISIFGQLYAWGQFFPDYQQGNLMLSLTATDTLELAEGAGTETLPSERVSFWQRNLQNNSEGLKSLPKYARDNGLTPIYSIPLIWDENTPQDYASDYPVDSFSVQSRDNRIYNDDTNFPHFKFNHNMYDTDPQYTDTRINDISDNVGEHIIGWFSKLIWQVEGAPEVADLPSYNWDVDGWAGTNPADYPVVWPRFDGSYSNPDLLTASIEKLPLGDLNWFPDAKAKWEANKDAIMDHILALNEDQFIYTGAGSTKQMSESFSIYPNPVSNVVTLESKSIMTSLKVYNITGQVVMTKEIQDRKVDLDVSGFVKGVYVVDAEYREGGRLTSKFVKE